MDKETQAAADLEAGTLFAGRYRIERLLGEGDRKRTYFASDEHLLRHVALAVVKPEAIALDPAGTRREAQILARLATHDNVVGLYDMASGGAVQYLSLVTGSAHFSWGGRGT